MMSWKAFYSNRVPVTQRMFGFEHMQAADAVHRARARNGGNEMKNGKECAIPVYTMMIREGREEGANIDLDGHQAPLLTDHDMVDEIGEEFPSCSPFKRTLLSTFVSCLRSLQQKTTVCRNKKKNDHAPFVN